MECSFYPFDAELECKQNVVVYDSISTNVYFRVKRECSLSRLMPSWSVNKMKLFTTVTLLMCKEGMLFLPF